MTFFASDSEIAAEGVGGLLERITAFLQSILGVLDGVNGILDGANGFQEGLNGLLESLGTVLDNFLAILMAVVTIFELSLSGVLLLVGIATWVLTFLFFLLRHLIKAYPHYKLMKNLGRKHAWVALLPIMYCDIYALARIPGREPFALTKRRLKLEERTTACWIYICIDLFGTWILNAIVAILQFVAQFIPGVGQIIGLIMSVGYLIPIIFVTIMEFIFIKDMLNVFKENKKANKQTAAILAIADILLGMIGFGGYARALYMYSLLKKNPIPQNVVDAE